MLTVHTTPEDAQFQALYDLGIFTLTDLLCYAKTHSIAPSELLGLANV